jgi:microcystin-dependent protein
VVWIKVANTNTGASTLQLNGIAGPLPILNTDGTSLEPGQMAAALVHGFSINTGNAYLLNPVSVGLVAVTTSATLTSALFHGTKNITATADVTLPANSTVLVGRSCVFHSSTTGAVRLLPNGTDTIDGVNAAVKIPSFDTWELQSAGSGAFVVVRRGQWNIGDIKYSSSPNTPAGFLAVDNTSQLRTSFQGLFNEIGTTWGAVDGTHFNLPPAARIPMATGLPFYQETQTGVTAVTNFVPVNANNTTWITGMLATLSGVSGFGGTIASGGVYVIRVNSNYIGFATTLAVAQNGTPNISVTGTGNFTLGWSGTARTLGEIMGEETHAMSGDELLQHHHVINGGLTLDGGTWSSMTTNLLNANRDSNTAGGNVAMNIIPPTMALNAFIKT